MQFKHIDLKEINEISENNLTTIKYFLNLSLKTIFDCLQKLDEAFLNKDFENIYFFSHKLKSTVILLNIKDILNDIKYIETSSKASSQLSLLKPCYDKIHSVLEETIKEIETYIILIENDKI